MGKRTKNWGNDEKILISVPRSFARPQADGKLKNVKSHQVEPCDLTEFSTSLEYFGAVKFRPNCSSNHSASLAFHLDCSNPGGAAYRLEFVCL